MGLHESEIIPYVQNPRYKRGAEIHRSNRLAPDHVPESDKEQMKKNLAAARGAQPAITKLAGNELEGQPVEEEESTFGVHYDVVPEE